MWRAEIYIERGRTWRTRATSEYGIGTTGQNGTSAVPLRQVNNVMCSSRHPVRDELARERMPTDRLRHPDYIVDRHDTKKSTRVRWSDGNSQLTAKTGLCQHSVLSGLHPRTYRIPHAEKNGSAADLAARARSVPAVHHDEATCEYVASAPASLRDRTEALPLNTAHLVDSL